MPMFTQFLLYCLLFLLGAEQAIALPYKLATNQRLPCSLRTLEGMKDRLLEGQSET